MKIFTYNILAPSLAAWENYKNHKYCPKKYMIWSYRKKLIMKQILVSDADVICLQEIQNDIYYNIIPKMYKCGYIGIFTPKNKSVITGVIDGCAIFIKQTYQFIKFKSIDYYNLYKKYLRKNTLIADTRRGKKAMCGLVCLIKKINTNYQFVISTIHLIADPTIPDVKNLQTICVLNELSLMSESGKIPFILCGDFNSLPNSSVYETITTGYINFKNKELLIKDSIKPKQIKYKLNMKSSYKLLNNKEPEYTNYTDIFNGTLDYIFVSNHWNVKKVGNIPSIPVITNENAIPNSKFPSDHIPLSVDLTLKKKQKIFIRK